MSESVGAAVKGSRIAVDGSGTSSMSDLSIACQPLIEEPSKPSPSANADSSKALSGSETCCQRPSRSTNLRSTILVSTPSANSSASFGAAEVPASRYCLSSLSMSAIWVFLPIRWYNKKGPEPDVFRAHQRKKARNRSGSGPFLLDQRMGRKTQMADMEIEIKKYLEAGTSADPQDALEFAEGVDTKIVDLKFVDLLGRWQHVSLPLNAFDESAFAEGLGFDGSSIRGWQAIDKSDMLLVPDPSTAILDPFTAAPTLSLICDVRDPITGGPYDKDPRFVARRAEEYLRSTGVADTVNVGPELEFFIFDSVAYDLEPQRTGYAIDSEEAHWNTGKPGLGYQIRGKEGYFPPAPHDTLHDIPTEMVLALEALGIACEYHHHEVATAGQCEIDMRFDSLLKMAEQVMIYKYVVKNVARRAGKTATFMPKPLFGDNGSGMHVHQSLWKESTPLFADKSGYAGLSQLARSYVGGLLKHCLLYTSDAADE